MLKTFKSNWTAWNSKSSWTFCNLSFSPVSYPYSSPNNFSSCYTLNQPFNNTGLSCTGSLPSRFFFRNEYKFIHGFAATWRVGTPTPTPHFVQGPTVVWAELLSLKTRKVLAPYTGWPNTPGLSSDITV